MRHFRNLFIENNRIAFEPASVKFADGQLSIVTPPVVERIGSQHIIIEGTTRCTVLRDEGVTEIRCVVARDVAKPLPAERIPMNQIRVIGKSLAVNARYEKWDYELFRPIESTVHNHTTLK